MLSLGDPSEFPAINCILESARGSEIVELHIKDRMLQVGPESITCTALTRLSVSAPTSVGTMLAIIGRLPNLVKLTFFDLCLRGIQADISIPDADADAAVEPLHKSLNGLAINYERRRLSPDMAVAVAKYVLLRIPSLTQLVAVQTPASPVVSFVEEYASCYPHLSSVQLKLNDSEGSENYKYGYCV
ncbi:hypothetical protein H4R21_000518 [Coemansia helicoidea]|uniref:Uncharacterized protein n=1 Tax=Coemansia helicoidea TaxID=1286919 RepID=A0ACC1LFW3_9FUNG|nr:hypothetical protein H4R21_000518 [Coemansia helicoidea]